MLHRDTLFFGGSGRVDLTNKPPFCDVIAAYDPLPLESVMDIFFLVYNAFVAVTFVGCFMQADRRRERILFLMLAVIQTVDMVRLVRG